MAPVFTAGLPVLKNWSTPLDLGRSFQGKRIFGDHKTVRGIISGAVLGGLVALCQFVAHKPELYNGFSISKCFLIGASMGFGALLADAIKSFFKRRVGVEPGKPWVPFDQTDYIIGGLLFLLPFIPLSPLQITSIIIVYFGGHLLTNYIGYHLGIRKRPI